MLSDEMIAEIGEACGLGCKVSDAGYPCDMLWFDGNPTPFARAIESEVRKQDESMIRELVEALDEATTYTASAMWSPSMTNECKELVAKGRVRLEGKS